MSTPHRIDVHQHVVPPFWAKALPAPAVPTNVFKDSHVPCGRVVAPGCSTSILSH
jgi:hypothetical protein